MGAPQVSARWRFPVRAKGRPTRYERGISVVSRSGLAKPSKRRWFEPCSTCGAARDQPSRGSHSTRTSGVPSRGSSTLNS